MKKIILALGLITTMTGVASAACTEADLQAKATDAMTKLQQVIMKDPSQAQKWQQKMTEMAQKGQEIKNLDDACSYYDDVIKEIEKDL